MDGQRVPTPWSSTRPGETPPLASVPQLSGVEASEGGRGVRGLRRNKLRRVHFINTSSLSYSARTSRARISPRICRAPAFSFPCFFFFRRRPTIASALHSHPVPRGKEGNSWCQTPVRASLDSRLACMHHSHRRVAGAGHSREQLRYMVLAGETREPVFVCLGGPTIYEAKDNVQRGLVATR